MKDMETYDFIARIFWTMMVIGAAGGLAEITGGIFFITLALGGAGMFIQLIWWGK